MKIGFLYNHDALHQVAHTAPVAAALAARGVAVQVLTSSEAQEALARELIPAGCDVTFVRLRMGGVARMIDLVARAVAPFARMAALRRNLAVFAALDALVVPETTSALLKSRFGLARLTLVYLPHGAGDRSVGFRAVTRQFDLVLLAGRKVRARMLQERLIRAGHFAIVGYPKFDAVGGRAREAPLFADDRPVVLYNPHFDPLLSSWYDGGIAVLDWFAGQDRFNLIFAPHVMLFKRRLHASVEHARMRLRRALPRRFEGLPRIRIDLGSRRSVDMTYVDAADIYLGDGSSQVYEFLSQPRPCIFLNLAGAAWRGNANFAHWSLGETIETVAALPAALDRAVAEPDRHSAEQIRRCRETFDVSATPAGVRAADAILAFLQTGRVSDAVA